MSNKEKSLEDLLALHEYFALAAQELQAGNQRIKELKKHIKRLEDALDAAINYCEFHGPVGATPDTTKLLLKELRKVKEAAPCSYCYRNPCECSDFDVMPDMGAK